MAPTILLVEDDASYARLIQTILENPEGEAFDICRVDRLGAALDRWREGGVDLMLLDLSLPDSQGLKTFESVRMLTAELPVIVLTGLDDTQVALKAVGAGAQDYLLKNDISPQLLDRSIRYALERHRLMKQVKRLQGLLPICSGCKKIRDTDDRWSEIETYVRAHSEAEFSHGLCPTCDAALEV